MADVNKAVAEPRSARPNTQPRIMYLVNLKTLEKIKIQFVPGVLNWQSESSWVVIPTVGRNNPFYHWTGAEQTLEFQLDWHSMTESRNDVINACRWVEDLSRSDGYEEEPPPIRLIFGKLFEDYTFIVDKAPFEMSLFDASRDMLPRQAYQNIILKRVTALNSRKFPSKIEPRGPQQVANKRTL